MQQRSSAIALTMTLLIAMPCKAEELDLKIKLAGKSLARSIRAYVTATVAFTNCQVEYDRLSEKMAKDALPQALLELGISPKVLNNPQISKAVSILQPSLDSDCRSTELSNSELMKLIKDEL